MPAPEGYTELDLVGFTDKGNYSAETTYAKNDLVHSSNKIYKSLQDNNTGQALPAAPEIATAYWEVWLSGGVDSTESLTAKDTDNLTGGGAGQVIIAQELLDAITAKVIKQLSSSDIVQTESTATNKVPSAAYLKEIKDGLDNDISELTSSKGLEKRSSMTLMNNKATEISFGNGVYFLVFNQGGSRFTSGIAYVNMTSYINGSFVSKIVGGKDFMSDTIQLTVSAINMITINNQDTGTLSMTVYAFV